MRLAAWTVLVYGLLVGAGGIIGYLHAHSLASLFASLPFAIALFICAPGLFFNKRAALYTSLALVLVLDAFFTYRFSLSLKWMPAGMMVVTSLITLAAIIYSVRKTALRKAN